MIRIPILVVNSGLSSTFIPLLMFSKEAILMYRLLILACLILAGYIHGAPRVVLVTGASQGIGRETVLQLASEPDKFKVYGTYFRNPVRAGDFPGVTFLALDQTDPKSISRVIADIKSREKRLDVLVNNAGIGVYGPLEALSSQDIQAQFQANLVGPVILMKEVLPLMRANRYGRLINVSSTAGAVGLPFMDVYSGSKFGLEGTCAALAGYVGRLNDGADIHCRIIEPGFTRTDFRKNSLQPLKVPPVYREIWPQFLETLDDRLAKGQPPREVALVILEMINDPSPTPFRVQPNPVRKAFLRDEQKVDISGDSLVVKKSPEHLYPGAGR